MEGSITAEYDGTVGPGSVTSGYWLTPEQRASYEATLGGPPQPLVLNCGSVDGLRLVTIAGVDEASFPFATGDHPVDAVAFHEDVPGYVLPPDNEAVIARITAFDDTHVAGSVSFTDPSVNGSPVTVELTFDLPRA